MPNPPIHIVVEHGRVTLDRRRAEQRRPDAGAIAGDAVRRAVGDQRAEDRRGGRATPLKSPSELTVRWRRAPRRRRSSTARPEPRAGAALILGHGAGAGQRSAFMVDFARALAALGLDVVTFNFLYTEQGRQDSGSRAGARGLLSRGDRRGQRARRERAQRAVHRRQVDGRAHRHAGRGRRSGAAAGAGWCCSAIRCIRRAGRPSAATSICRRSRRPMLFVQGSRDAFGTPDELAPILGAAAAAAAAARRRAAITRSSCRGRIRRRRRRSTPTCSARSSAS